MASRVEPRPVVEPDGVHEQRVSFPLADGHPTQRGVHIPGMTAYVRVNDAKRVLILEKDGRHSWGLNDLERHDSRLNPSGRTDRQTLRQGIVDLVLLVESLRCVWCERRLMPQGFRDVGCERRRPNPI